MINHDQGLGGSTPQFNTGGRSPSVKPLLHSYREQALILQKYVMPGFGAMEAGTVMAKYSDMMVPYVPATISTDDVGRVFLAADAGGAAIALVPNKYGSRFEVGQELAAQDTASTDLGAVVSIEVDATPGITKITVTNNFPASATTANNVNIFHKTKATTPFSEAAGVMDIAVTTGEYVEGGPEAQGAQVSYIISNAIFYDNALVGMDTAAATSLGVTVDSPYAIMK